MPVHMPVSLKSKNCRICCFHFCLSWIGAGSRIRTDDLLITNQLLYQLSYAGVLPRRLGSETHSQKSILPAFSAHRGKNRVWYAEMNPRWQCFDATHKRHPSPTVRSIHRACSLPRRLKIGNCEQRS